MHCPNLTLPPPANLPIVLITFTSLLLPPPVQLPDPHHYPPRPPLEEGDLGLGGDASDGRAGTGYQRGYTRLDDSTERIHVVFVWYM